MSLWRKRQFKEHDGDELEIWNLCIKVIAFIGGAFIVFVFLSLVKLWIG